MMLAPTAADHLHAAAVQRLANLRLELMAQSGASARVVGLLLSWFDFVLCDGPRNSLAYLAIVGDVDGLSNALSASREDGTLRGLLRQEIKLEGGLGRVSAPAAFAACVGPSVECAALISSHVLASSQSSAPPRRQGTVASRGSSSKVAFCWPSWNSRSLCTRHVGSCSVWMSRRCAATRCH